MKESANMAKPESSKTSLEVLEDTVTKQASVTSMLPGLQQELDKIKGRVHNESHSINLAHMGDFAGNDYDASKGEFVGIFFPLQNTVTALHAHFNDLEKLKLGSWVIDT